MFAVGRFVTLNCTNHLSFQATHRELLMVATLSRKTLLHFPHGHSEMGGLNLSISTHHRLQNGIMDKDVLVLLPCGCVSVCVCVCVCGGGGGGGGGGSNVQVLYNKAHFLGIFSLTTQTHPLCRQNMEQDTNIIFNAG